jgi:hypothetical protein
MAKIFESDRIIPAWHAAARYLLDVKDHEDFNLVLEVAQPLAIAPEDRPVYQEVDRAIRTASKQTESLLTVMGTIFPQQLYDQYGRPALYEKYRSMLNKAQKPNTWGTYADRMMTRAGKDGLSTINPLDILIEKLKANLEPHRNTYRSSYEIGISDPEGDMLPWHHQDIGGDIPTYNPALDANRLYGLPCLSHVSFKLIDHKKVNLVAIYRSHHYCSKGLGNLLGLARLQRFVAIEAGLEVGNLTCISTHAVLDVGSWGGIKVARDILCRHAQAETYGK